MFSWFSSVLPRTFRDNTSIMSWPLLSKPFTIDHVMTASFQTLYNLPIIQPLDAAQSKHWCVCASLQFIYLFTVKYRFIFFIWGPERERWMWESSGRGSHSLNRIYSGTTGIERWIREDYTSGDDRRRFHCM
jgi:hypothetical protein